MIRTVLAVLVLTLTAAYPTASAQVNGEGEVGRLEGVNVAAPGFFYKFAGNEPVISVTTVGSVVGNGVFFIGEGANVADLLALAGGVVVDRAGRATVRIYRSSQEVFEIGTRDLYSEGFTPPTLQEGDVVEVVGLTSSVPGFYVHTQPGVPSMDVTASGAFVAPGRYTLNEGSTVGDLVAFAGGLGSVGVRDSRTDVEATVRLYRGAEVILESPLSELYAQQTLTLQPGDAVDLEVILIRRGSFWRDALSITTAVLSAVVLVDRLTGSRN